MSTGLETVQIDFNMEKHTRISIYSTNDMFKIKDKIPL